MAVTTVEIPVRLQPLEDGWVFLICDSIQGCLAEAETVEEEIPIIEDVARIIVELCEEKSLPLPAEFKNLPPGPTFRARVNNSPHSPPD